MMIRIRRQTNQSIRLARPWLLLVVLLLITSTEVAGRRSANRGGDEADDDDVIEVFKCDGGKKEIPLKYINDDFCDCSDGTDEPQTSACSHVRQKSLTFQCNKTVSALPQKLLASRIHDTVCDCCDGSDESDGICPNTCDDAMKQYQEETKKEYLAVMEGRKLRDASLAETRPTIEAWRKEYAGGTAHKERLQQLELRLKVLQVKEEKAEGWEMFAWKRSEEKRALLQQLEVEKQAWVKSQNSQQRHEEEGGEGKGEEGREEEGDKVPAGKAPQPAASSVVTYDLGKGYGIEKIYSISATLDRRTLSLKDYLAEDDLILSGQKKPKVQAHGALDPSDLLDYALEFIGVLLFGPCKAICWGIIISIGGWVELFGHEGFSDYFLNGDKGGLISSIWEEVVGKVSDLAGDAVADPLASFGSVFGKIWNGPDVFYSFFFPHQSIKGYERLEAALIRRALVVLKEELDGFTGKMKELKDKISSDLYGPDFVYVAWKDRCIEKKDKEFTYKVCPFNEVKQNKVLVGRWMRWGGREGASKGQDRYERMFFDRGNTCWNGPTRSAEVTLQCDVTEEIIEIWEPSVCVYNMVVTTPLACDDRLLKRLEQKLDALGIEDHQQHSNSDRDEL